MTHVFGISLFLITSLCGSADAAVRADSGQTAAPDPNVPTPVAFDECHPDPRRGFFIKNRFASCTVNDVVYQNSGGSARARVVTTSNLLPESRDLEVSTRMIIHHVDGVPATDRVGIEMNCAPGDKQGTAACDVPSVRILKSIADWQAKPVETHVFSLTGAAPASPSDSPAIQAEQRTKYTAEHHLFAESGTVTAANNTVDIRCDTARLTNPLYAGGSDCVFGMIPLFILNRPDPSIAGTVAFVRNAFGVFSGYHVPGNAGHPPTFSDRTFPVRRLFHDTATVVAHREAAERSCVQRYGPDYFVGPGARISICAVVPIDATYEGATPAPPGGDLNRSYAVQPVLESDYLAFLALTERFTRENHILDGDYYYLYVFG